MTARTLTRLHARIMLPLIMSDCQPVTPTTIFRVAYMKFLAQSLRPNGRIAIIDYKQSSWIGCPLGHATSKEIVRHEMEPAGYRLLNDFDFLPKQHFQIFALKIHE